MGSRVAKSAIQRLSSTSIVPRRALGSNPYIHSSFQPSDEGKQPIVPLFPELDPPVSERGSFANLYNQSTDELESRSSNFSGYGHENERQGNLSPCRIVDKRGVGKKLKSTSKGISNREALMFQVQNGGPSIERMQFFASSIEEAAEGGVNSGDDIPGLEPGRVIEVRRSEQRSLGVILASILVGGRPRLLILRQSGELWPVSPADVQFVMPASLIPSYLAASCWSPRLLKLWSRGEDVGLTSSESEMDILGKVEAETMLNARRQVTMVMRKVARETEKMESRLMGGALAHGRGGGVEGVWENFAPSNEQDRAGITAVQAAEWILNTDDGKKYITVRPGTLPAFAAHALLMGRPDLFLADDGEMWSTQQFLVRSRAERARIARVTEWVESNDKRVKDFVRKCNDDSKDKDWTEDDLDMISVIANRLYETRSTQISPYIPISTALLNAVTSSNEMKSKEGGPVESSESEGIRTDGSAASKLLHKIGVLPLSDSVSTSLLTETALRHAAMSSTTRKGSDEQKGSTKVAKSGNNGDDLLDGTDLDYLREDYTGHRVYVIDDATASELDDGVSIQRATSPFTGTTPDKEEYWIHIHIADPTRFLSRDHPLAIRASFAGTSSYLPEGSIPLIPHEEVMTRMSLGGAESGSPQPQQGVMTFSALVNMEGKVKDSKINLGFISKPKIITYADVNEALGLSQPEISYPLGSEAWIESSSSSSSSSSKNANLDDEDVKSLSTLRKITQKLRSNRFINGGLEFSLPFASVRIKGSQPRMNIFDHSSHTKTTMTSLSNTTRLEYDFQVSNSTYFEMIAQNMIGELMVLANRLVAEWCYDRSIPIPYRGSDRPKSLTDYDEKFGVDVIRDLLKKRKESSGFVEIDHVLRSNIYLPPAQLSDKPIQHWMMGITDGSFGGIGLTNSVGGYTRATSPLRRYDDLLVHWQIKSWLERNHSSSSSRLKKDLFTPEQVFKLSRQSHVAQLRARRIGLTSDQYWRSVILADLRGEHHGHGRGHNIMKHFTNSKIDLNGDLEAIVTGPTVIRGGESHTPVLLLQLGTSASMSTESGVEVPPIAQRGKVRIRKISGWPIPIVDVLPVSF